MQEQQTLGINDRSAYYIQPPFSWHDEQYQFLKRQAVKAYPAGQSQAQYVTELPTRRYQSKLEDLAPGWQPVGFDGLSLKLANLDFAVDLTDSRAGGVVTGFQPFSEAEYPIVQLTAKGIGYRYWNHRFPNAKIFPLSLDNKQMIPRDLAQKAQHTLTGKAELFINPVALRNQRDWIRNLLTVLETLSAGGSAAWRLSVDTVNPTELAQYLTWLNSCFASVGLIQLVTSPADEFWLWAKQRVLDKELTEARYIMKEFTQTSFSWGPNEEQQAYLDTFFSTLYHQQYFPIKTYQQTNAKVTWLIT